MNPLLVVNPRSGGGQAGALFDQMRDPIERAIGAFDVLRTERPRHAVDLARDAALEGRETIIAVGGDGVIHEVVNGLMQAREQGKSGIKLGIIGQGTGGDFRKTLGIDHRIDKYCAAIAGKKTIKIDVPSFSYADHDDVPQRAYFVNILSIGLGGLVDQLVANTTKAFGGTVAYFVASLRGLLQSEIGMLTCTIEFDGHTREEHIETRSLAICNGRCFGGGMQVAPMAALDDGILEIVDLGNAGKLRFARVSSKIYDGAHINHPDVTHFRANAIRIELENKSISSKFLLDVDGEPLGRMPIDVKLERGAIEVFVP